MAENAMEGMCYQEPPNRWRDLWRRVSRRSWWWTSRPAWWIYRAFPDWIDEPEAYKKLPRFAVRVLGGIREACWTHVCGHGIIYSLHCGNIHWRFPTKHLRELDAAVNGWLPRQEDR